MLWSLAFVPVRQKQCKPRVLSPFRTPGRQELIDHDLGDVHEVPELGLPQDDVGVCSDRIAILEAYNCGLGQRRIVEL